MNQAFLIITHKNPEQLLMLLKQLEDKESFFFIHIDLKSDIAPFKMCASEIKNITFIKERFNLKWGAYGIVNAIFALFSELVKSKLNYSHAHLLSGEDISLKSIKELINFFSSNVDQSFIEFFKLPSDIWMNGGLNRITRYHFGLEIRNVGSLKRLINRMLDILINDLIAYVFPFTKKKIPKNKVFYAGSSWFSLNKECSEWLVHYAESNDEELRFFKTVFAPDETLFHTIILNSRPSSNICNNNKRYIDWSKSKNGGPTYLVNKDFEILKKSNCFFARKVDFLSGKELYQMLP